MKKWIVKYWNTRLNNHYTLIAIMILVFGIVFFRELETLMSWIILILLRDLLLAAVQFFKTIATSQALVGSIVTAVIGWVTGYFANKSHKK